MPLPTRRIFFSPREVQIILPGLEELLNRTATAKLGSYPFRDAMYALEHPEICGIPVDQGLADYVLSARNGVRWINPSRQPRFNFFEIAAAGVALRLARREKLVPETVSPDEFLRLEQKLERHRRRIWRDTERANGKVNYQQLWQRWKNMLRWMHFNIYRYSPRRWSSPGTALRRQQREQTRNLALRMVTSSVDPKRVIHLADLARREVRRGRHDMKLRVLLEDQQQTLQFFQKFLVNRLGIEAINPEYYPEWYVSCLRSEKMRAAETIAD